MIYMHDCNSEADLRGHTLQCTAAFKVYVLKLNNGLQKMVLVKSISNSLNALECYCQLSSVS